MFYLYFPTILLNNLMRHVPFVSERDNEAYRSCLAFLGLQHL